MKTVGFFPDGVGVRNFILGSFLKRASENGQMWAFHLIPDELLSTYQAGLNGETTWNRCLPYKDSAAACFLRKSVSYAHLCNLDTQAMRYARSIPVRGNVRMRALTYAARALGRAAASPTRIQMLDRWHHRVTRRLPEVEQYRKLFKEIKPSVLFSSHQRPLEIIAPVLAARSLDIPTATFIFSWDNITSKGRIAAPFDHFLVWSDNMRRELRQYYPEISPDQIHVVGTPQFDPYADEELLWSREEFCRRAGADPKRRLICYSGGEPGSAPEDPHHLRVILQHVRDGRIRDNPQVLLRPAPVTRSDERIRYSDVCEEFPDLVYCQPQWARSDEGNFAAVVPTQDDIQFLANLTHHADVNVNVASTMTLDFAIRDTPVVNIAFNVVDPPPFGIPLADYCYQYEHYVPVAELGAAQLAKSPSELADHINTYLENPDTDREGRRKFVELELDLPIGRSCEKILKVLKDIAA